MQLSAQWLACQESRGLRWEQEDRKFKATVSYIGSLCLDWAMRPYLKEDGIQRDCIA